MRVAGKEDDRVAVRQNCDGLFAGAVKHIVGAEVGDATPCYCVLPSRTISGRRVAGNGRIEVLSKIKKLELFRRCANQDQFARLFSMDQRPS